MTPQPSRCGLRPLAWVASAFAILVIVVLFLALLLERLIR